MKKSAAVLLAICFSAAVLAAGCGSAGNAGNVIPAPSTIAVMPAPDQEYVTVTAKAEVNLVPDKAEISFGVNSQDKTAEGAQKKNAETISKVIETLKARGVEEKSIRTSRYNLYPEYDYNGKNPVITGYSVSTALTVSDQDIDEVGSLLTACVEAGANNVDSLRYFCSGYDEAYQEALAKAVDAAAEKAAVLASAGGRELGVTAGITEGYQNTSARYSAANKAMSMAEEAAAADMVMMPGETKIEANVTVTYHLN